MNPLKPIRTSRRIPPEQTFPIEINVSSRGGLRLCCVKGRRQFQGGRQEREFQGGAENFKGVPNLQSY